jgi:hypothetical protein
MDPIPVDQPVSAVPNIPPWRELAPDPRDDFQPAGNAPPPIPESGLRQRFQPNHIADWDFEFESPRPAASATATDGAFYGIFTNEDGETFLQGGSVTGGNGGSATIDDYMILDADGIPTSTAGTILYAQAAVSAATDPASGIMLPGCALSTASLATAGSVPPNSAFTVAVPTGNLYVEVGRWTEAGFARAFGGGGNLTAAGCIGNFSLSQ